jgi:hypothetical protein
MNSSTSSRNSKLPHDIWEESALNESSHSALDRFSVSMNDDFLVMDDLDIEDDFSGLLDITSGNAFEDSMEHSNIELPPTRDERIAFKRVKAERSLSPPPKRRRSVDYIGTDSPMSTGSVRSTLSASSIMMHPVPDLHDLQDQYKLALQHLALSMRRSEMTRNEIIRQRQLSETQAKIVAAQKKTFTNADKFLTGSTSTLTIGLEQSRSMLRSYMAQVKSQMM